MTGRCNGSRLLVFLGRLILVSVSVVYCSGHRPGMQPPAANVIVMVPDGSSQSIQALARWYKGKSLSLDGLNSGTAKTFMANSVITDSAAAATAFATGHKTSARFLGIGPRTQDLLSGLRATAPPYEPVASVLEAAKLKGKAVGVVVTSRVSHATPAAFGSHVDDRDLESEIMEQMVYQDIDVVFGGGAGYLIPRGANYTATFGATWQGMRPDRENLMDVLKGRGYLWVDNKTDLAALRQGKVWGLFNSGHLEPQMDRDAKSTQPTLAEMTAKAIEILSRHKDGFFLLVEGSQVDWAAHGNDPAYMITEFLAFDAAVGQALAFAESDGHTSVYIWPDHNTGGLTIGNAATFFKPGFPSADDRRPIYTSTSIESLVAPLRAMKISAAALAGRISDPNDSDRIKAALAEYWGIRATDRDLKEIEELKDLKTGEGASLGLAYALSEVVSRNRLIIGWTSHGHGGEDVPVWSWGPQRLVGTFDNTELAGMTAKALGLDLAKATSRLFVDLATVYPGFSLDTSDSANPVVTIGREITLKVNKDILQIGDASYHLNGLVVYAPKAGAGAGKVFIPREAVNLIKKHQGFQGSK